MPYQDLDDVKVTTPQRSPTLVRRWLRRLFVDDWGVKLLALGITLVLWMLVADFNKPRTIRTPVQLTFIRPTNLDISNEPPRTIDVELTGSRERLNNMKLFDLVATVDISDSPAGERLIRLNNERVHMDLPDGVKIDSFKPTSIQVRLEPNLEKQLPIEIKLEGQPAAGYEVVNSVAQPNVITVRGPSSLIGGMQRAATERISIEGRKGTFTVPGVSVAIPDSRIEVVNPLVDVTIEIAEKKSLTTPVSSFSGSTNQLVATIRKPEFFATRSSQSQ